MRKLTAEDILKHFGTNKYTVKCDKFDIEDFTDIKEASGNLLKVEEEGLKELNTYSELMQDLYSTMFKIHPHLNEDYEVRKEMLFNYELMRVILDHRRTKEIRAISQMDKLTSAIGVESITPEVTELIKQMKEQKEAFEAMLNAAQEAEEAAQAAEEDEEGEGAGVGAGEEEDEEEKDQKGKRGRNNQKPTLTLEEAKARLEEARANLKEAFDDPAFKNQVGQMIGRVRHKVVETTSLLQTWGLTSDSTFSKSSHREKMELVKKLSSSTKLKKVSELAGRLIPLAMNQQTQKVKKGCEEIYNVELGSDLSRLLPQEISKLNDPDRELEFMASFFENKCLQYSLKGKEKKARGAIVVCIDESGSMEGEAEIWSKAVAIALLHIAVKQKRSYFVIHFDATHDPKRLPVHAFPKGETLNMLKLVEMAELFMGGGTDFETPLTRAKMCIDLEKDYHKADIIFITDGECAVRDSWQKEFMAWKKEKGISIYSILINTGINSDTSLKEFSTQIYKLSDFKETSEDVVLDLFMQV